MHGEVKQKVWKKVPRTHADWVSRALSAFALIVCAGQLVFYLAERQAFLREDLYVELVPSSRNTDVLILKNDDRGSVVVGFAFEGRIINVGKSATTISRWEILGASETWQASTATSFSGCSGLSCIHTEPTGERSPPTELKFPSVVASGTCLDFEALLHVEVRDEFLAARLRELAANAQSRAIPRRVLETELEDVGDLCGNLSLHAPADGETETRWLAVTMRIYTNRRKCYGYRFLWAPPYRISEGRELRT